MNSNPLAGLKFDYWYKILPAIGSVTLVIGLTFKTYGLKNLFVIIVSVGIILIGIGEWINHPLQTTLFYSYKITSRKRINTFSGNLADIIGIGLVILSFARFW